MTQTRPVLPMIPDNLRIPEDRFSEMISRCDPTVAKLGEAFLVSNFEQYFEPEMLRLLHDARKTWV